MGEHTKGPWTLAAPRYIRTDIGLQVHLDVRAAGETFATLVIPEHERMEEPTVAKLRLLLEAPELLDALERLAAAEDKAFADNCYCICCGAHPAHGQPFEGHSDVCALVAARAAIARALGKEAR